MISLSDSQLRSYVHHRYGVRPKLIRVYNNSFHWLQNSSSGTSLSKVFAVRNLEYIFFGDISYQILNKRTSSSSITGGRVTIATGVFYQNKPDVVSGFGYSYLDGLDFGGSIHSGFHIEFNKLELSFAWAMPGNSQLIFVSMQLVGRIITFSNGLFEKFSSSDFAM